MYRRGLLHAKCKCTGIWCGKYPTVLLCRFLGGITCLGSCPVRSCRLGACQPSRPSLVFTLVKRVRGLMCQIWPESAGLIGMDGKESERTQVRCCNGQGMSQTSDLQIWSDFSGCSGSWNWGCLSFLLIVFCSPLWLILMFCWWSYTCQYLKTDLHGHWCKGNKSRRSRSCWLGRLTR